MSYAPHWDPTYHHVIWETVEDKLAPVTPEPFKEQPPLNRAERRRLARYIARKARAQMRHIHKKHPGLKAQQELRCGQCGLRSLGGSGDRCQCKASR